MTIPRRQIDFSRSGNQRASGNHHREWTDALEPGSESFEKCAGNMLHQRDGHWEVRIEAPEQARDGAGTAGGADDSEHAVAAEWKLGTVLRGCKPRRFLTERNWLAHRMPAHYLYLAHDGQLRTDAPGC